MNNSRYYLPLKDKIRHWVSSEQMCYEMLGHWRNKDSWMGKPGPTFPIKEIWDGERFKELQWFWNPQSKWPLPHSCSKCDTKLPLNTQEETLIIKCNNCSFQEQVNPSFCFGDPRNIAFIGHWDGWQPNVGSGKAKGSGMYLFLICIKKY